MNLSFTRIATRALAAAGPLLMAEFLVSAAASDARPQGIWMLSDTSRCTAIAWRFVDVGKSRLWLYQLNDGRLARRWTHDADAIEGNYTVIPFTIVPSVGRMVVACDIVALMVGKVPDVTAVGLLPEDVLAEPDKPASFMAVFPALDLDLVKGFALDGPASVDTLVQVHPWK